MSTEAGDKALAKEAAVWAANLYEERTRELGTTGSINMYSVHPEYRVSWHEVVGRFPDMKGPIQRVLFQPFFDREIRKRELWKVLKGKQYSDEWVQEHPIVETP